jgi:hypothetical protein
MPKLLLVDDACYDTRNSRIFKAGILIRSFLFKVRSLKPLLVLIAINSLKQINRETFT